MFEHRKQPLLPRIAFVRRVARSGAIAVGIIIIAWAVGAIGYHHLDNLPWIDAQLNAAMILAGMGPVSELHNAAAKIFASLYALFSGFVFLTVAGVLFSPLLHRMLHRFHLEPRAEGRKTP
ncbi:MAG TPA: hypothetical protein VMV94_21650 [Phycisphaerae bacterium]|nr:hypothetical protein [Phycisphaerae bacterium]